MSRTVLTETRSQQALQSYLDGLLQDAAIELADSVSQDEFQAAVLEEQLRDTRQNQPPRLEIVQPTPLVVDAPVVEVPVRMPPPVLTLEPVMEFEVAPQLPANQSKPRLMPIRAGARSLSNACCSMWPD